MKRNIRNSCISSISYMYVVMLIYAATSKLLDFDTFRIQLGQSPLMSAFAFWISIAVPVSEISISLLLLIPKLRFIGLFAAYTLMVMFTAYIYIIVNYSAFVPCSCGGILEKMTWDQHLIFNGCFIVLAGIAIVLIPKNNILNNRESLKL